MAKLPTFADGRGSEVFRGRVLHSMEYSAMAHADAAELVRGKRVAVVGAGKSAMDIVAQCAEANGEIDTTGLMLLHCLLLLRLCKLLKQEHPDRALDWTFAFD